MGPITMGQAKWLAAVFVLSGLVSGCTSMAKRPAYLEAGPALQREIDDRVANIQYLRGRELVSNLRRLIWIGEPAIPTLLDAVGNADPKTRGSAAYVLGEIRDPRVVEELRDALGDRVPEVRYEVAASLVTIGDWSSVPTLIEGLADPSPGNRNKCIGILKLKIGKDFGYVADASETDRYDAIRRWHEWWASSRNGELL